MGRQGRMQGGGAGRGGAGGWGGEGGLGWAGFLGKFWGNGVGWRLEVGRGGGEDRTDDIRAGVSLVRSFVESGSSQEDD